MKNIESLILQKSYSSNHGRDYLKIHPLAIEEFFEIIEEDEEVMFVNSSAIKGKNRNGMIFITNKRVVVSLKLFRAHIEQFHYEHITAVDYNVNWLGQGVIEIDSYGTSKEIYFYTTGNNHDYLRQAVEYIRNKMLEAKETNTQSSEPDLITQLERLGALKQQGILTEDEFQEQKRRLLQQ